MIELELSAAKRRSWLPDRRSAPRPLPTFGYLTLPVSNCTFSCRSGLNRTERQLLDLANVNSRPIPDCQGSYRKLRQCGIGVTVGKYRYVFEL